MQDRIAYPTPQLAIGPGPALPGHPLPLRLELVNATPRPFSGGTIELTVEVEKGVLLTWNVPAPPVAAGGTAPVDCAAADPAWLLPLATPPGSGVVRAVLRGLDGAYLDETGGTLAVIAEEA